MSDLAPENDQAMPDRRVFLKQVATVVGAAPLALGTAATVAAAATLAGKYVATEHDLCLTRVALLQWHRGTRGRSRSRTADSRGRYRSWRQEAGVAVFIDLQLVSAWGNGDHFYRQPPFLEGTPQQGYQLAFTPAEMFRLGFAKLDESARNAHGAAFADLSAGQQDALLAQAQQGKLDFGALPSGDLARLSGAGRARRTEEHAQERVAPEYRD